MTIFSDIQWFQMFSFSFIELQNVPPPPQPPKPIFSLNPNRFDLPPGASFEMFIEGFVERYVYMNVNGCSFSSSTNLFPHWSETDKTLVNFFSPQFVKERMLCHAIIGRQGGKELIMRVDVSADFISPLLEFSTKSVYFRFDKVSTSEYILERF